VKLAHLVGFIMKKIERNSFYVVKVKFALQQATKPERSSSGVALIFNLGARWRWVVNATLWPLYPPRKSRYPLHRKLGWPDGRFGRLRKIAPPPTGFDPRNVHSVPSCCTDWATPVHTTFFIASLIVTPRGRNI